MSIDPANGRPESPSRTGHGSTPALGSLAAVAALLAATSADAGIPTGSVSVSSTVSNTALTNGATLDINGDTVNDFYISFFNSQVLRISGYGTNATSNSGTNDGYIGTFTAAVPLNQAIGASTTWGTTTALGSIGYAGPGTDYYAGVRFAIGANTHYGWVRFTIPQVSGWVGSTAVSAAWQTVAGLDIAAGAVPAPGAVTVLLGAGLLRRRRRG
jgi:hypothetical protein